jgi:hypothetical protein
MNWQNAKQEMTQGKSVQRSRWAKLPFNARIYMSELGGFRMFPKDGDRKNYTLFDPDFDDVQADDWCVVEEGQTR